MHFEAGGMHRRPTPEIDRRHEVEAPEEGEAAGLLAEAGDGDDR